MCKLIPLFQLKLLGCHVMYKRCSGNHSSCAGSVGKAFGRFAHLRIGWRWSEEGLRSGRICQQRLNFNVTLRKESIML